MKTKKYRTVGDTYPIQAVILENSQPVDITGAAITFNFKKGSESKITLTGEIIDGPNGKVNFTPTTEQVSKNGTYNFNIKVDKIGVVTTYLKGQLILEDDL